MNKHDLTEIVNRALARGGDFADLFIEHKVNNTIQCEQGKIDKIKSGIDMGAGIRLVMGDSTAYAYTNKVTREELLRVADVVSRVATGPARDVAIDMRAVQPHFHLPVENMPDAVKLEDKVDVVMRANKAARALDPKIKQVMVGYGDVVQDVTIANSLGRYVCDRRVRTRFTVNAIAVDGSLLQTGYESTGESNGFEMFNRTDPETVARKAAQKALMMLKAKPAPSGTMAVVMAGEAGGTMVHEACGHGLEADLVQKKLSVYAEKKHQVVANEQVTVVDDGTLPQRYGSTVFDDEGFPVEKTVLIRNGVLQNFMYDYVTSRKDHCLSTGNGRRESFQHKPIPRMRNTYIAPGTTDPSAIMAAVRDGLLVKKMGGGEVNTINGDFVFDVAEGYVIENGEITHAVRGATLTGNGPEVLKTIDMVGNDIGFTIGICGKDGQGAPVSDAQPTIHIPAIVVGGTLQTKPTQTQLNQHWENPATIRRIRRL